MTCYRPLFGAHYYERDYDGQLKPQVYIYPYQKRLRTEKERLEERELVLRNGFRGHAATPIDVKCGHCLGCRLDKSLEWAQRCMAEYKMHDPSTCHFITLTYDDDHLPFDVRSCRFTLLEKSEFSDLFKTFRERVREKYDAKIRFYMCAEYGEKFERPHYHLIVFGLPLDDLEIHDRRRGLYRSLFIEDWWNKGFSSVGKVTAQSVAYVARYTLKKQMQPSFYEGRTLEWTNMSNRPGIGRDWYEEHKEEIYRVDGVPVKLGDHVFQLKPARYYDKLFDIEYPDQMDKVRVARIRASIASEKSRLAQTDLSLDELRMIDERTKAAKIQALKRSYEQGDS